MQVAVSKRIIIPLVNDFRICLFVCYSGPPGPGGYSAPGWNYGERGTRDSDSDFRYCKYNSFTLTSYYLSFFFTFSKKSVFESLSFIGL